MWDGERFVPLPEEKVQEVKAASARGARVEKVFQVGEEFEINGVAMRVRKITSKDIVLRPIR